MSGLLSNKGTRPYIYGLIATWVIGCLLQYLFCCKGDAETATVAAGSAAVATVADTTSTDDNVVPMTLPAFELADADNHVLLSDNNNLTFAQGSPTLNPVADALKPTLAKLPTVIPADKALKITGYYLDSETAPEGYANAGIARAENIVQWLKDNNSLPTDYVTAAEKRDSFTEGDEAKRIASAFALVDKPQPPEPESTEPTAETAPQPALALPTLTIPAAGAGEALSADGNLTFPNQSAVINPVADNVVQALSQLPQHVPGDKALSITGYYLESETAPDGFDSMGLARAEAVKQWLLQKQYAPTHIVTKGQKQPSLVGRDNQHLVATAFDIIEPTAPIATAQAESSTPQAIATTNPLKVSADGINVGGDENFNFISGDFLPTQPIAQALDDNLTQVVEYLNAEPARQLTLTGRYHPDEHNGSAFPDLGLARANQVKEHLTLLGAKSQQITLASSAYPDAVPNAQQQYAGMVDYTLSALDGDALQARSLTMQQLADDIRINPLTLYFDTGVAEIALTDKQRQHLLRIAQYLDFDQTAKAVVTGHTDNVGSRETNTRLGKERAEFAAEYLSKNGLRRAQMLVDSKGPDQPIADNNSEDGRAKNRRVTITINENNQ